MIPLSDELPTVRTPWMTYTILAAMLVVWIFVQGAGFDQQALAASLGREYVIPDDIKSFRARSLTWRQSDKPFPSGGEWRAPSTTTRSTS